MELVWDQHGDRVFESGIDRGVLYIPDAGGAYADGVAWNGLMAVTEKPTGAAPTAKFADNIKYLNLFSVEEFGAELEAFTYPDEFSQFDGLSTPSPGLSIGQQGRRSFGLSYRSRVGNDVEGSDFGYKLHLIYGATASPSDKAYGTINDTPDAIAFKWALSTQPVPVPGLKPTSFIVIDSTKVDAAALADLERQLYGDVAVNPVLPLPGAVIALFGGAVTEVVPAQPAYNAGTHTITIPVVAGVTYYIDGIAKAAGPVVITHDTIVTAQPNPGSVFAPGVDNDWYYNFA